MKFLKERNPLLARILVIILFVLLGCIAPKEILFLALCIKQDLNIPPGNEILVSACKRPYARSVPGGEFIFVHERRTGQIYLLDLRTKLKIRVPNYPRLLRHGIFLNSELVWLEGSGGGPSSPLYTPDYIFDITKRNRYELTDLTGWFGDPDPPDYVPYFESAGQIFIHHGNNRAIALPLNLQQNPEKGVILYRSAQNMESGESIENLMKDLGVPYENIDYSLQYVEIPSPSGRYIARREGIYFSKTGAPLMTDKNIMYRFVGWYYDESGVAYNAGGKCYFSILLSCLYHIPGNVLKLNLPAQ